MAVFEPGKIRNVAVVGHRGTGKTSLVEAMLFQAGRTNRLGTVDAGSTVADRERADFSQDLDAMREELSERCVVVQLAIGSEHELMGIVDLVHMCAYTGADGQREGDPQPIPTALADQVAEYREKLLDEVVQVDEALMERYLDGQELSVDEVAHAL